MKKTVTVCDKCGKECPESHRDNPNIWEYREGINSYRDVCPECATGMYAVFTGRVKGYLPTDWWSSQ